MEGATLTEATPQTEDERVRDWRVSQFEREGFTKAVAELFADLPHEIDLNRVRAMRAAGATTGQIEAVLL